MNVLEKVNFISNWIKNYANNMPSKAQSLVIGISGGIDSSVSSTLSAMTGLKTIVLSMPIKQNSQQHDLSIKHQEWLVNKFDNIEAHTINLDELFSAFSNSLSKFNNEHGMANSRARLRMTTLYQVAAANKGIVVGTGNKVEDFGVGFYTKYGDGGVDISPIADCNKSEIWEIGKELGILNEIIDAVKLGSDDEMLIGIRLSGDEKEFRGIELQETLKVIEKLNKNKKIDYINVTAGTSAGLAGSTHIVPSMRFEAGYTLPLSKAIKCVTSKPIFVAGRINTPQMAEEALINKAADMCGMTRAIISDPQMPKKAKCGQFDEITTKASAAEFYHTIRSRSWATHSVTPTASESITNQAATAPSTAAHPSES